MDFLARLRAGLPLDRAPTQRGSERYPVRWCVVPNGRETPREKRSHLSLPQAPTPGRSLARGACVRECWVWASLSWSQWVCFPEPPRLPHFPSAFERYAVRHNMGNSNVSLGRPKDTGALDPAACVVDRRVARSRACRTSCVGPCAPPWRRCVRYRRPATSAA